MFELSAKQFYTTPTPFPHLFVTPKKYIHNKIHGKKTTKK